MIFRFIFLYKNIGQQSSVTVRHVDFAEGKINIQVWRVPLFTVDPRHGASDYRQNGFFAASQKPRVILKTNCIRVKPLQRKRRSTTVPAFENRTLLAGKMPQIMQTSEPPRSVTGDQARQTKEARLIQESVL